MAGLGLVLIVATVTLALGPEMNLPSARWQPAYRRASAVALAAASRADSVRRGESSSDVLWIQVRLAGAGAYGGPHTGLFGPQTEEAVRRYQSRAGIEVSGIIGPITAQLLAGEECWVKVQPGQTLNRIAAQYGLTIDQLRAANPDIVNPNRIFAGQMIRIPVPPRIEALAGGGAAVAAMASTPAAAVKAKTPAAAAAPPASAGDSNPSQRDADTQPAAVPVTSQLVRPVADGSTDVLIGPGPQIHLTFDGPLEHLPNITSVLTRHSVPAAVFVAGEDALAYPELVKAAHAAGITIQSAAWSTAATVETDPDTLAPQLIAASRLISELTGRVPAWVRPNGPLPNAAYTAAALVAAQRVLLWHNIGALPDGPTTVKRLDRHLIDGAVIRLPLNAATVEYLEAWIVHCIHQKGVRFRTLSGLVGMPRGW